MTNEKQRLDIFLVNKLKVGRNFAKESVENGDVTVYGKVVLKPSMLVCEDDNVQLNVPLPKFVGRGGLKLEHALETFDICLDGKVCVDVGASTGGFTHCMILSGAKKVYAIENGKEQLSPLLKEDEKVVSMEQTNINDVSIANFQENYFDFVAVDVSFVSVTKVMQNIMNMLSLNENPDAQAVFLIKPQFEAGKESLNKKGIVKNVKTHIKVLEMVYNYALSIGFCANGLTPSPIKGGDGNVEYLMFFHIGKQGLNKIEFSKLCNKVVLLA